MAEERILPEELRAAGVTSSDLFQNDYYLIKDDFPLDLLPHPQDTHDDGLPVVVHVDRTSAPICRILGGGAAVQQALQAGKRSIKACVGVNRNNETLVRKLMAMSIGAKSGRKQPTKRKPKPLDRRPNKETLYRTRSF